MASALGTGFPPGDSKSDLRGTPPPFGNLILDALPSLPLTLPWKQPRGLAHREAEATGAASGAAPATLPDGHDLTKAQTAFQVEMRAKAQRPQRFECGDLVGAKHLSRSVGSNWRSCLGPD